MLLKLAVSNLKNNKIKLVELTCIPFELGTDTEPHDRAIVRAMHSEYSPNKLVKGNPSHTLFIGRLNPRTTEVSVTLITDLYIGR